jgi:integrase
MKPAPFAEGTNPRAHRKQEIPTEGANSTLGKILRIFNYDALPLLGKRSIHEIKRPDLLEVIERIERRKALSIAQDLRGWLNQFFRFALVKVPELEYNPASDLDVVAIARPPTRHHPFLRMNELPDLLRALRKYPGDTQTWLGVRLLLLTGVRTCELRLATPEQFDLEHSLWKIPSTERAMTRKKRPIGINSVLDRLAEQGNNS